MSSLAQLIYFDDVCVGLVTSGQPRVVFCWKSPAFWELYGNPVVNIDQLVSPLLATRHIPQVLTIWIHLWYSVIIDLQDLHGPFAHPQALEAFGTTLLGKNEMSNFKHLPFICDFWVQFLKHPHLKIDPWKSRFRTWKVLVAIPYIDHQRNEAMRSLWFHNAKCDAADHWMVSRRLEHQSLRLRLKAATKVWQQTYHEPAESFFLKHWVQKKISTVSLSS